MMFASSRSRRSPRTIFALLCLSFLAACGSPEERAQKYYDSAIDLIAKKDDIGARRELFKALKYNADKIEVWRAMAGINERTGQVATEFQDLRRIVELDPNDLDARLKMVRLMVGSGAPADSALKLLEPAKEDKPNSTLHSLKAILLFRTDDADGAKREAQRALEIDPRNMDAIILLASLKIRDGDADGALKLLGSTPIDPKDELRVSVLKAQAFSKKGDLPQTEAALRKLVSQNPKELAFRDQLIKFYIANRRVDDAEKELRSIADAKPGDNKAELDVVRFLNSFKGPAAARDELNARIKAGGDVFDFQMTLVGLELSQGNTDAAISLLQGLVATAAPIERKQRVEAELAEIYVNKSNFAAAEPLIADVLQKDRRNIVGLRLRASIHIDRGEFDSAISDLREALNDQPNAPELLVTLAIAYERSGKNELADRQYAEALKFSKYNPSVAYRYLTFLQRRGDAAHADEVFTDVASNNPRNLQILTTSAQLKLARQNWTGALGVAETIASLGDDQARGQADEIRAAALAGQNKPDQALSALERAHAAAPDAVQPVVALASAYLGQHNPTKAELLIKDMLKKFPNNPELLVLGGQVQLAQNKADEALQSFQAAIAKQPKDPAGYNAASDLYVRQKNYDAAIAVMASGLKEQPDNLNFRMSSAGLQILKGDPQAAIASYESILKDQPNSLLAINNLVSLLLDTRSDEKSLSRAISLADALKNSSLPQFQDTFGWARYKAGDFKTAVSILEAAEVKLPNLAAVRYHLGMTYLATGQADKAADQLKSALALEPDGTALKANIRAAMK